MALASTRTTQVSWLRLAATSVAFCVFRRAIPHEVTRLMEDIYKYGHILNTSIQAHLTADLANVIIRRLCSFRTIVDKMLVRVNEVCSSAPNKSSVPLSIHSADTCTREEVFQPRPGLAQNRCQRPKTN